jgi:uncharacterized membrane protein
MNKVRMATIGVVILTLAISIALYPSLPDQIPSHWNAAGEVDGYFPKFWGTFFLPLLMAGLVALLIVIPGIDPLRENYEKFTPYYDGFILFFALFLFIIQVQVLLWSLGFSLSPNLVFPILFGLLFIYIGILLEHAEQNWFVGIRTPWTLSSRTVWKKTHERGGLLFKIAGILSFPGIFAGPYAIWFIMIPILVVTAYTIVYSYLEFEKERRSASSSPTR